jgi:spore germination protein
MRQLQILIILSAMGTGMIVLPRRAAEFLPDGAQDGWVIAVGLVVMAIALGALISTAARAAQEATGGASFIESVAVLFNKPLAYALGIIFWAKLVLTAGLELKIFLKISNEIMLPNTPTPIVGGVMLAVCAYAAAKGMETRARVAEVLFALMIIPFLFVFVVALLDADFSNLQPSFANDARNLVWGSVRLGFILTGLECLLLVTPFVPREKNLKRAVMGAIGFAGLIIIAITLITIASIGGGVESEPWPVLGMTDAINIPGSFIERQEALMFGFWIITAFALGNALLFFGGLLLRDMFKRISLSVGVILTAAAVFCVSIFPFQKEETHLDFMYMTSGLFFLVILPIALLIASKIQKKLLLLIFCVIFFTGCWDKVEIENRAFVVAMGIDKGEENYVVTLSIPVSDDEENSERVKSATGRTIPEALKKLDKKDNKQLFYGQTKVIVFGEDLLDDRELFCGALKSLDNVLESTRRIHVLAAKDAEKILETKPPDEIFPNSHALDFQRLSTLADGCAIIPKIERYEDELQLSGAIAIKNLQAAQKLSPEELQGFLWCFPNGNKDAVVSVEKNSMKVESHKVKITFTQPLTATIEVFVKGEADEPDEFDKFSQKISQEIIATAKILQAHALDAYDLREQLRKKNYRLYKHYTNDWQEIFPTIEIIPVVSVKIS